jgi:hypothetical protein
MPIGINACRRGLGGASRTSLAPPPARRQGGVYPRQECNTVGEIAGGVSADPCRSVLRGCGRVEVIPGVVRSVRARLA